MKEKKLDKEILDEFQEFQSGLDGNIDKYLMGSAKFEFATSASQTQNHTKLDHDPK
jgi:hypothetical protein